jgi:RND family efflux transporter MFP subunit
MKKITLMLMLGALLVAACTGNESGETAQKEYQVKVATIERAIVRQDFEFTGNIEPMYNNNISSSAAQRIEKVYAEVGTRVKRGQLLVEMENINYASAKIQLENLKLDLSRIEALYRAGGVAEQQYDQIKTQVKISEESLANLAKNTRLLSPIDGIVVQKNFDSGDLATGMPILVVMQMQPVKILINISEEYFPQVKSGTPVEVSLDIYPEKRFKGSVTLVHPVVDPNTRTFVAEVRINNPALEIRPGMFARARVDFGTKERVVVPDRAVVKQSGTNDKYVYVLDGDVVHFTKVELGRRVGPIYEVLSGLEAGDKVVIAGNSSLKDKATVKVVDSSLDLTL